MLHLSDIRKIIITILVRRDSPSAKYLCTSTPETQTCISMSVLLTYHLRKWSRRVDRFLGNLSGLSEEQAPCEKRHTVELFFPKYSGGLSFLHEELHNNCIDCYFQTFVLLTELGHGTFRQFKSHLFPWSRVCGQKCQQSGHFQNNWWCCTTTIHHHRQNVRQVVAIFSSPALSDRPS